MKSVEIISTKDEDLSCNTCREPSNYVYDLRFQTSGGVTVLRQCYSCLTKLKIEAEKALF